MKAKNDFFYGCMNDLIFSESETLIVFSESRMTSPRILYIERCTTCHCQSMAPSLLKKCMNCSRTNLASSP